MVGGVELGAGVMLPRYVSLLILSQFGSEAQDLPKGLFKLNLYVE